MQRILLVEDNQAIVENLEVFLQTEGFLTLSTARQDEALEILSDCTIDLVLLDLTLAEGSGFSLCAEIKAKWSIPIIILTANSDEFSTVACFDLGADDYVTKPFRPRFARILRIPVLFPTFRMYFSKYSNSSCCLD